MKWFLFVVLVGVLVKVSYSARIGYRQDDDYFCNIDYFYQVGCFKDGGGKVGGTRPLTEELLNIRDPSSPVYEASLKLDWKDWKRSLSRLVCECAKRAYAKDYPFFGVQYYGECWSGPNSKNYAKDGKASTCVQEYDKQCNVKDEEHPCAGAAWTNYVYRIAT